MCVKYEREGGRERGRERERERVLRLDGNLGRALHTHRGEAFRGCTRAGRSGHELWHSHLTYTRAMALTPNLHRVNLSQAGAAEVRASEQDALNATLEAKVST